MNIGLLLCNNDEAVLERGANHRETDIFTGAVIAILGSVAMNALERRLPATVSGGEPTIYFNRATWRMPPLTELL